MCKNYSLNSLHIFPGKVFISPNPQTMVVANTVEHDQKSCNALETGHYKTIQKSEDLTTKNS